MQRCLAALVLASCLQGCAARTPPVAPPATPTAVLAPPTRTAAEQLHADLAALFASAAANHAHWGVHVVSLRTGETLFDLDADRFFVPASNGKIVTTAIAAERLGWDYRFTTRILATSPISDNGTLNGDLIVVGDGDPSINPRHPARWRAFDDWAAALRDRGLKVVAGRLIADDDRFAEPGWGPGWAWDDLHLGYAAPVSALQFNENRIDVIVGPGMTPGAPAVIATTPADSGVFPVNLVTTGDPGSESRVSIDRQPGTPYLDVRGRIAFDAAPVTVSASVDNPTRFYANALETALRRHGIVVAGNAVDIDEVRDPVQRRQAAELLVDRSPPLSEIADVAMKWSRNIYAETMLMALAPPDAPATHAAALGVLRSVLESWGVASVVHVRDGSGLSRDDSITPRALTTMLRRIAADPARAAAFRATLAVAGESGLMANRMKGTAAEGRIAAKTGSLTGVRAISGYAATIDGEPLAFSIIANNYQVAGRDIDALADRAVVRMVEFSRPR